MNPTVLSPGKECIEMENSQLGQAGYPKSARPSGPRTPIWLTREHSRDQGTTDSMNFVKASSFGVTLSRVG
jgi:hypothetical protein